MPNIFDFMGRFQEQPKAWRHRGSPPPPLLYSPLPEGAISLSGQSFNMLTRAQRGDDVWLVHFFSKRSYGCRKLSTTIATLATSLQGLVKVAVVDCDAHKSLCERQQIRNTPTVKLLSLGNVDVLTVQRALTRQALSTQALAQIRSKVLDVRRANHLPQLFELAGKKKGCVLLFTDKYETTPLYKRLSGMFSSLVFGEVRAANKELSTMYGVEKYPTLLFIPHANAAPAEYVGQPTLKNIQRFLRKHATRQ